MTSTPTGGRPRRRVLAWVLVVAFVVVPLVEIYVLVQVGQVIGAWWTILLLVADSILGGWLVRREGAKAWAALRSAVSTGVMPARELTDAALVLVAGTLMLTPGFVLDLVGLFLVLPVTRPIARRALTAVVARRLPAFTTPGGPGRYAAQARNARRPETGPEGSVVRGEVVDDPPTEPRR